MKNVVAGIVLVEKEEVDELEDVDGVDDVEGVVVGGAEVVGGVVVGVVVVVVDSEVVVVVFELSELEVPGPMVGIVRPWPATAAKRHANVHRYSIEPESSFMLSRVERGQRSIERVYACVWWFECDQAKMAPVKS